MYVTNNMLNAQSLDKILQNDNLKKQIHYSSKIAAIFHKTAYALDTALTKYQLAHLRLCPSSILVNIPEDNQNIAIMMVAINDFGIGREKK